MILIIICVVMDACNEKGQTQTISKKTINRVELLAIKKPIDSFNYKYQKTLQLAGLVSVADIDSSITIALKYATTDNFLKINLYNSCKYCYVHPELAKKLKNAQSLIKLKNKNVSIVIFDATRPACIQQLMWDSAKMNMEDKRRFLANPKNHSLHNYGMAIDCSLIDETGKLLDMGTDFDYAGELAFPCMESSLEQKKIVTANQIANRKILRNAMLNSGFTINPYEWWHFNACTRTTAQKNYNLISDFSKFVSPKINKVDSFQANVGLIFKVQIITSPKLLNATNELFKGLKVDYYVQDTIFKYTIGKCKNFQAAYSLRDSVAKLGFIQAFVVCFNGTKRVSVNDFNQ